MTDDTLMHFRWVKMKIVIKYLRANYPRPHQFLDLYIAHSKYVAQHIARMLSKHRGRLIVRHRRSR
jgi:hypothetical protein